VILHRRAAWLRLTWRPVGKSVQLIIAAMLMFTALTGFAGCSGSEDQVRQTVLKAQEAELKAEQAEAAANRARAAAQQAQIAADRAQKAVEDAAREIDRVAEHLDRIDQAQGAND